MKKKYLAGEKARRHGRARGAKKNNIMPAPHLGGEAAARKAGRRARTAASAAARDRGKRALARREENGSCLRGGGHGQRASEMAK